MLTLLIVPASFSLAVGVERWIGPQLGRRLLTYRPGDDGTPVIDQTGRDARRRDRLSAGDERRAAAGRVNLMRA